MKMRLSSCGISMEYGIKHNIITALNFINMKVTILCIANGNSKAKQSKLIVYE